ncbi:hypothetical protein ACI7RC_20760 [Brevibacillus sp. B_LB10_24]
MKKLLFLPFFLIVFAIQGCLTNQVHVLTLEGESDHWSGTVKLTLTEVWEDHKKQNGVSKNIVLRPKEEMELERLTYDTSFNIYGLGGTGSNFTAKENEVLNDKVYGEDMFGGTVIDWTYDEVKQNLEYAAIKIEWVKDGNKYHETITAKPSSQ